jgi:phosphatidylethanolamine/phosphatidyl-N-methylethanolamine N-methyltransferase
VPAGDIQSMPTQSFARVEKKPLRLDDDVRFIRSWLEKPLATGAVMPSGRALARTMARYVDPDSRGPIIELGPGTGPVTEALVDRGIDPSRLILVEFNPVFCRLLRSRYPAATVVQGDAYRLRPLLGALLREPAGAVVSGLPLVTKPLRTRLRLMSDALGLLAPNAPFVQFTYAMVPPIPKALNGIKAEASELIWMNLPPARVWVYRGR